MHSNWCNSNWFCHNGAGDGAGTGHDAAAQPKPVIGAELEPCSTQSTAGNKRRRKSTSPVWEHFEEIFEMRRGKEVRVGAKCKHCKKLYSGLSSGGTGHLTRHIPKCPVLKGRHSSGAQSLLQFNSDGSVANWEYSPEFARVQLVRLIARLDLPLGFGESEAFDDYITTAHNPRFTPCSRQTTTRDLTKYFN